MKIILLSGDPNTGKTTTFHTLYDQLTQGIKNPPPKQGGKKRGDFHCVLKYKGKQVALHSHGDIMHIVYRAIIMYSEVDYLILAHSIGGREMNRIRNAVLKYTQHCLISKTVSKSTISKQIWNANNLKDCQKIIKAII